MGRELEGRSPAVMRAAIEVLRQGGTLLYPTDTIYGLGCDAASPEAVEQVRLAKQRPSDRTFLVLASSLDRVRRVFRVEKEMEPALARLWPGPRTVLLPPRASDLDHLTGANGKIGVRVPRDAFLTRLFSNWDGLLVSTSANLSGEPYRSDWRHLRRIFQPRVDLLLRRRVYRLRPASALLDFEQGHWIVLRPGPLPLNFFP